MANDIAIKANHVDKDFILPHEKVTSVKSAFMGMFNRNRTKEAQHALRDVSFEIKKGEFFGIVGRNGSGKSTMLKILAGIYQPTRGSVHTYGKLVPFIELGVGFNPELTGRENVFLNGAMLGFSRKEIASMYDDIVAFAELERFMDQKLRNYSSGMQVRLAFSMATRAEADILLVDEVLAVGDADFQRKCFDYFRALKRNQKTVVFVSHDMDAVREYCDRAVLIDQSEVVAVGGSESIAAKYTKMFIDEARKATSSGKDRQGSRWGSRSAVFTDVSIDKPSLTDDDAVQTLNMTIQAHKEMENVTVGFVIKNPTGHTLLGTNNHIVRKSIKGLHENQRLTLEWEVPNIFSEGNHTITIALESGNQTCDWWEDAVAFTVYREKNTPYIISPSVKLKVRSSG